MFKNLLCLAAVGSLAQFAAADLNFIFGAGTFAVPDGGQGQSGQYSGFSLITDTGEQIFDDAYVNDYNPCFNTDPESRIEASSSCWEGPITFHCKSDFGGLPETCSADYRGNHFDGSATEDTTFIGIAISMDARCGGSVVLDVSGCTADNADVTFAYPT